MAKTWIYNYNESTIKVINSTNCSELYINGVLKDKNNGINFQDTLMGKLSTGETVKVSLGGTLKVECTLFIDGELQIPADN